MRDKEDKLEEENKTIKSEETKVESQERIENTSPQHIEKTRITEAREAKTLLESSAHLVTITEMLKNVISLIENKISYDETKEKMFQSLYQQLKEYKEGFVESIQKPIIKILLPLYDSVIRIDKALKSKDFSIDALKNEVDILKSEFEEVLYQLDVTPFIEHPEILDRKIHKTIKVIETSDPNEDKKIVEIVRYGFFWKGNILRPEEVTIERYNPQKEVKNNV